ncbi:hypothetical protein ANOM_001701 [Aspergillus nomiae NRRL 13137]|uniref:MARVEL domain-containing protein n=1 Tax=Aspergillus nomiae NRRL (strain ATCC 15546 / NRRL 13137 / CBS 260.88 / M93) TaxID=1509407 RepID=A0A0L1JDS3_ASPN3|nr:uncharacterized protein ANOM_001701 [Aspergillus nomiae NRRL 13137]KNG89895.1 hypothetical protein ANOM_001701 [Aspergillus nomiae NRRL 13137]
MNLSIDNSPKIKFRLHIIIGSLLLLTFILVIARVADKGTPSSRTNTWGIAVCVKSAVFMTYQIVTAHAARFKRWASSKANMILNIIDTLFWFALFIISIMGTSGSHSTSSRALGVIIVILALVLCGFAGFLSFICVRDRRYYKQHGSLPGVGSSKSPC